MKLTVNGQPRDVPDRATILSVLTAWNLTPKVTVVERNGQIVDRAAYGDTTLADNDVLELVRFVGGG